MQHVRHAIAGVEMLDFQERRARGRRRQRGECHARLAEIDLAHARVIADRLRRAVGQHLALVQHDDPGREPENDLHVVLDQQDRHLRGQLADLRQHAIALARAHAGGRLVEQQQARPGGERERDLEEPPVAVREHSGLVPCAFGEPDAREEHAH